MYLAIKNKNTSKNVKKSKKVKKISITLRINGRI